jgi:hypothetical protein
MPVRCQLSPYACALVKDCGENDNAQLRIIRGMLVNRQQKFMAAQWNS